MKRKDILKLLSLTPIFMNAQPLHELAKIFQELPKQGKKMPVLFTSHGIPMDIPVSRNERPFWKKLYELGIELQNEYEVKAAVVISAHWCTNDKTYVNISPNQKQIFDYYGFPKEYYEVYYSAKGAPEVAKEITSLIPNISETTEWGLDHGAWPMLMHLFPEANVPVFELSIAYNANPIYHYELGKSLKSLRDKGVLIIGSGALIHNLSMIRPKLMVGDRTPLGWEAEYDTWLKKQLESRNRGNLINYTTSHKLGLVASPTPDHFVPVLYSLGLMDPKDELHFFYESEMSLPAFSERSFILKHS